MPDFSPAMLRFFLRGRVAFATHGLSGGALMDATRKAKAQIRKAAGVTNTAFDLAFMGRLDNGRDRARLWGALGIVPGDRGVLLTDDGGQHGAASGLPLKGGTETGSAAREENGHA
ncbi:MAG: hypothetical protein BGN85_08695 [Alphaproteobacteria bacterium 64-11]|nr:MAG: hypothetical protein BGN85_08695 [Alphaproteobacteria bacterium 64-11]